MDAGHTIRFARADFRNDDRVFGIMDDALICAVLDLPSYLRAPCSPDLMRGPMFHYGDAAEMAGHSVWATKIHNFCEDRICARSGRRILAPRGSRALCCDLFMNGGRVVIKSCRRKGNAMSDDDMKAELERLRSENAALKKGASDGIRMKVSEKGAVSVYGMGRFPVTLYKEQWLKLLNMSDEIRAFIAENEARLKAKD